MGLNPADVLAMQERVERARKKVSLPALPSVAPPPEPALQSVISIDASKYDLREFVFHGLPMGKPRMTQRDKWKKRPVVLRYNAFKDALRAAAGTLPSNPDVVIVHAHVPMPPSWSKKKQAALVNQPCRQKPDWDNIGKAVCDTLFDEDCCIWLGATVKYWCLPGAESITAKIYYAKP